MAIKNFSFLRNKHGLKRSDGESKETYKDISMPLKVVEKRLLDKATETKPRKTVDDFESLVDLPSIISALVTMFTTRKGGRPLVPRYGIDLREYLGRPMNPDLEYIIKEDIITEIQDYETRVQVLDVSISSTEDENEMTVKMKCGFPNMVGSTKDIFVTLKGNGEVMTGYA